ncbi:MAG: glutamate--cysteine ligase [Moraxella sp.]|nr:glutamate--cysteine ligase [Moraxella sp.]
MTTPTFSLPTWLTPTHLSTLQRGIEKEGLRMADTGYSAKTPHPHSLGSKLTHPYITTDYSENLLELITPPYKTIDEALEMLTKLHILVHKSLENNEVMWGLSMPCMLSDKDKDIPLADYGTSNIGKLKTLYRSGLGVRYGRKMQTIAGLHYNFSIGDELFNAWYETTDKAISFAEFKNAKYLALIRNFKRLSPIVLYLTGASPSVCACFVKGKDHNLQPLTEQKNSYYAPNATSLRMGKLGYTNSVQKDLDIRYNDLNEYIKGLRGAIRTPFADFTAIGVDDKDGNPIQINDHILQIENEFYSPIRPKQITKSGETPTAALDERGIAYIEFRAIDLDPYSPIGISKTTACFLEILALYCLLTPSAELLPDEEQEIAQNIETIVNNGRDDKVEILVDGQSVNFKEWLLNHLTKMQDIAEIFDKSYQTSDYGNALKQMQSLANNSDLTPSARLIKDSLEYGSTWRAGKALSDKHRETLLATPISDEDLAHFETIAKASWDEQKSLENQDDVSFYDYVQQYRHFE